MKIRNIIIVISFLFFLTNCSESAQQDLPDDIKQQAQKRIDDGYHLGTVIGIIDKKGTRYYSFGQISLTDSSRPDELSIFEIGSITKTFTSTLLADLDLRGEIKIENSVKDYLPIFEHVLSDTDAVITWKTYQPILQVYPENHLI